MPVRAKAAATLANTLTGGLSFNNLEDTVKLGPLGERTTVSYDEYEATYDAAYVAVIDSIDWNRVLIGATQRHLALQEIGEHGEPFGDFGDELCPECVCEALLAREGWPNWKTNPHSPR